MERVYENQFGPFRNSAIINRPDSYFNACTRVLHRGPANGHRHGDGHATYPFHFDSAAHFDTAVNLDLDCTSHRLAA